MGHAPDRSPTAGATLGRMAYRDDDEWPEPERDPQKLAEARRQLAGIREARQRMLRWTYFGLAVLLVIVIVLALTR